MKWLATFKIKAGFVGIVTLLLLLTGIPTDSEISYYDIPIWILPSIPESNTFDNVSVKIFIQTEYREGAQDTHSYHQVEIRNNEDFQLNYKCSFYHEVYRNAYNESALASNQVDHSDYRGSVAANSVATEGTANYPYVVLTDHDNIAPCNWYVARATARVSVWRADNSEISDSWSEVVDDLFWYTDGECEPEEHT